MTIAEQTPEPEAENGDRVPLTSTGTVDQRHMIDVAAAIEKQSRSVFILESSLEAARKVIKKHGVKLPESQVV